MQYHSKVIIAALSLAVLMLVGFTQINNASPTARSEDTYPPAHRSTALTPRIMSWSNWPGASKASPLPKGYEHIFGNWYRGPVQSHETILGTIERLSVSAQVEVVQPDYQLSIGPWQVQPLSARPGRLTSRV